MQDYAAEIRKVHIRYTGCLFNRELDSLHLPATSRDSCPAPGCDSGNTVCMSCFVMLLGLFDYGFLNIFVSPNWITKANGFLFWDAVQLGGPVSSIFWVEGARPVLGNNMQILDTYLPMIMEQSVPKRRHIKFRRRRITRKKAYNIQEDWNMNKLYLLSA